MSTKTDDYLLGRDLLASGRLNYQHFVFQKLLGFKIHPSIKLPPGARAADVGTGSGIYLFDLAEDLPSNNTYDGFDVDLGQCPPRPWVPDNMRLHEWDVFSPLPTEFEGAFDYVHVRLLLFVVKDGDPTSIVANLVKMLKPGGTLAWDEPDGPTATTTNPLGGPHESLLALESFMGGTDNRMKRATWVSQLGKYFAAAGLTGTQEHRVTVEEQLIGAKKQWAMFRMHTISLLWRELSPVVPADKRDEYLRLVALAEEECKGGAVGVADVVCWIGRKE